MTADHSPGRLPNFLIVGTMKSATTSLADVLGSHPDCFIASRELHFFNHDERYAKGKAFYATFFEKAGAARAVGEKTPSYSEQVRHPGIPKRIFETLGPIKLIWIFREPVARTVSHYRHAVMQNSIKQPFDHVIGRELDTGTYSIAPIVARSLYAEQVKLYLDYFPASSMHFCLFEEFVSNPILTTSRAAEFLGLDANPANLTGSTSRNRTGQRSTEQKQSAGLLGRYLLSKRDKLLESASPSMLTRLKSHFEGANTELSRITGLDLATWN